MATLVLLRHGQSTWNRNNLFTGWWDADLSDQGVREAGAAGHLLAESGIEPDVVHTSLQVRAIRTAFLALDATGASWVPVRRSWRLNERHYGDLTGRDKAETTRLHGADQVHVWRRSYDTPPPPIGDDNRYDVAADRRYASLPAEVVPRAECLKDVVERMMPYWYDAIVPDLSAGLTTLVSAHGNSLRALVKHLDGISDDAIAGLNIPTGVPVVYDVGADGRPTETRSITDRYLGDPEAVAAAAEAVADQADA